MSEELTPEQVVCPHCQKATGVTLGFDGCGHDQKCPHCGGLFDVIVDEDQDCNYWFEVHKSGDLYK